MLRLFLYFLPAYMANAVPVLCRGRRPIDRWVGEGTFGANKTLRGLLCGVLGGTITGWALSYIAPLTLWDGFLQGIGAMGGDLAGSFIKRRLSIKEGGPFITDASLFIITAMALDYPLWGLWEWWEGALFILITMAIHKLTNVGAFLIKLKDKPW